MLPSSLFTQKLFYKLVYITIFIIVHKYNKELSIRDFRKIHYMYNIILKMYKNWDIVLSSRNLPYPLFRETDHFQEINLK